MDLDRKGPMMVLACWQTPSAIRHAGVDRITALLRRGHVKNAVQVAEAMVAAARQQTVTLPGQRAAAVAIGQMATEILALEQRIAAVDELRQTSAPRRTGTNLPRHRNSFRERSAATPLPPEAAPHSVDDRVHRRPGMPHLPRLLREETRRRK